MKISAIIILMFVSAFFTGCNKDTDNSVTTPSAYKGTWIINSYTYVNSTVDSINVSLNMDGNNGVLTGTGTIVHGTNKTGSTVVQSISGNIAGGYNSTSISLTVTDKTTSNRFVYSGTQQQSTTLSYVGTAIIYTSTDTTLLGQLTFFKGS